MTVESAATGLPGKGSIRRMVECGVFVAVYVNIGFVPGVRHAFMDAVRNAIASTHMSAFGHRFG